HPVAIALVPHCCDAGQKRGPTAKLGQIGDGGIAKIYRLIFSKKHFFSTPRNHRKFFVCTRLFLSKNKLSLQPKKQALPKGDFGPLFSRKKQNQKTGEWLK